MRWLVAALCLLATSASARPIRPRFEPTDLELERPGTLELNFQVGYIDASPQGRVVLPDFEVDLGLTRRFEIDLDGTYAFDPTAGGSSQPDNLWLSGKIGFFDFALRSGVMLAGGVQAGPRFGVAHGAHGIGIDALVLFGITYGRLQLVINVGGYWDPAQAQADGSQPRPRGLQLGGQVDIDITRDHRWSFHAEIATTVALAVDPNQVTLAAGVVLAPNPSLELSLLALVGLIPGSDRAGALLGASPKLALWR